MFLKQLSIFIENREGRLEKVTETLAANGINIVCISLADTSEYGLLRMIVSDPDKGKQILKENGFSAMLTNVVAVKIPHSFGSLHTITKELSVQELNIEYMYAFTSGMDKALNASLKKAADKFFPKKIDTSGTDAYTGRVK